MNLGNEERERFILPNTHTLSGLERTVYEVDREKERPFRTDQIAFIWHASASDSTMRILCGIPSRLRARNARYNYFTWDSICGNTHRSVIRRYPRFPWNQSVGTYGRTRRVGIPDIFPSLSHLTPTVVDRYLIITVSGSLPRSLRSKW